MKRKTFIKILAGIVAFVVLIIFLTILFVDPWIGKKIRSALNEKNRKYQVEIDRVHVSIFKSGLELETIAVLTKPEHRNWMGCCSTASCIVLNYLLVSLFASGRATPTRAKKTLLG